MVRMERLYSDSYNFKVPDVYQIELVGGVCNLKCELCPVTLGKVKRKDNYFRVGFLDKMYERGDFRNTYYVELQMYGEPLLHPSLEIAIDKLHSYGIKVGMSTNLTVWRDELKKLDFVTVSADSILYKKNRNDHKFMQNLERLILSGVNVDIQVIEVRDWEKQVEYLDTVYGKYENVLIRSIPNMYVEYRKNDEYGDSLVNFCVNPFVSISIQSDGDVVPCCMMYGKDVVYGNIYEQSLEEIWSGEKHKEFVKRWLLGDIPEKCKKCRFRSPVLLHWRLWRNWVKREWI